MCDRVTLEPEPPDTGARVRESVNSNTACRVCNKSECFARPGSRGLRPGGLHTRTLGRPVTETEGDGIINTEDEVRPDEVRRSMLCWSRQRDWPEHSTLDNWLRAGAGGLRSPDVTQVILPFSLLKCPESGKS